MVSKVIKRWVKRLRGKRDSDTGTNREAKIDAGQGIEEVSEENIKELETCKEQGQKEGITRTEKTKICDHHPIWVEKLGEDGLKHVIRWCTKCYEYLPSNVPGKLV